MNRIAVIALAVSVAGCSTTMNSAATREVSQTLTTQKSMLALEECLSLEAKQSRPVVVRGERTLRVSYDMGVTYPLYLAMHTVTDRGDVRVIETRSHPTWRKKMTALAQHCA